MTSRLHIIGFIFLVSVIACAQDVPRIPDDGPNENYLKLEKLAEQGLVKGWDSRLKAQSRELRDYFVKNVTVCVPVLADRLEEISRQETEHKSDKPKPEDLATLRKQIAREGPLKYTLAIILAESYSHTDTTGKARILEVLDSMYTPSSYYREDLQGLNWALLIVGRDAIPVMFKLADHQRDVVRCSLQDTLNSVSEEISKTAPKLDCKLPRESQEQRLDAWWQWWTGEGGKGTFPTFPDPFSGE